VAFGCERWRSEGASVLDDYFRFMLAWDLKPDLTAASISNLVQQAADLAPFAK
jgi:hypothetical protein